MMMNDQHNTVMLPRIESRIQVICGLKAEVVANCDRLQNLTPPPRAAIQRKGGTVIALLKGGDDHLGADAIQMMTMKVSKGLELPVVAITGFGYMPTPEEDEKEAARVFYAAAIRATQRLVNTTCFK